MARDWWGYSVCLLGAILAIGPVEGRPLPVFVSILPQKYFVERVAGGEAEVSVMVGPGDSPETYEPTPRQLDRLSQARAYFEIGVPFEQVWMARLHAVKPDMLIVDTIANLQRRSMGEPTGAASNLDGARDPHVWTSPALVKSMAARIRDAFVQLDPTHTELYERNYTRFANDLDALDAEIRAQLAPYAGRSFLVFHAAWGYFAAAYGLQQIAIEAEGKEPGPRTLARVIAQAKRLGIKAVFIQPQFSRASAEMIAQQIGGQVIAVDPLAENYIQNMRHVAASFANAVRSP